MGNIVKIDAGGDVVVSYNDDPKMEFTLNPRSIKKVSGRFHIVFNFSSLQFCYMQVHRKGGEGTPKYIRYMDVCNQQVVD